MNTQNNRVEKLNNRFRDIIKHKAPLNKKFVELNALINSDAWKVQGKNIPKDKKLPVNNMLTVVYESKLSSLAITDYIGEAQPVRESDFAVIGEIDKIIKHVWDQSDMPKHLKRVYQDAFVLGTGIVQYGWDLENFGEINNTKFQGSGVVKVIDPMNFYPDPSSKSLEEARYVYLAEQKTVEELELYDKFKDGLAQLKERQDQYKYDMSMYDTTNPIVKNDYQTNELITLITCYEKHPMPYGQYRVSVTYFVEDIELLHIPEIKPAILPFAILRDQNRRDSIWGISTVDKISTMQFHLNELEAIIATHADKQQNPIRVTSATSGINVHDLAQNGNKPGHTFKVNGDPKTALHYIDVPDLPQSLYAYPRMIEESMRQVSGVSQMYTGTNSHSIQTKGGIDTMVDRASIRDNIQIQNIEEFLKDLTSIVWEYIKEYGDFAYYRTRNQTGGKTTFQLVPINWDWVKEVQADFIFGVSENTPKAKMDYAQAAKEAMEVELMYNSLERGEPPIITAEEYISCQSWPIKDAILERMERQREEMAQAQAEQEAQMAPDQVALQVLDQYDTMVQQGMDPALVKEQIIKSLTPQE